VPPLTGKRYVYEREDGSEGFLTDLDGECLVEFVGKNRGKPFFLYYAPHAIHEPNSEAPERYRARSSAKGARRYDGLMCTMDFYATAAAVAAKPLPQRCEGKNLLPYLSGEKKGDVHQELFWCNSDPKDSPHRHLRTMRWKQWRLVEYPDGWRLFDLQADRREQHNLAKAHPSVVEDMRKRYGAWVATLAPVIPWAKGDGKGGGKLPRGYGWAAVADESTSVRS